MPLFRKVKPVVSTKTHRMALIEQTPVIPNQPKAVPPVYFSSVTVENLKCFREPVTLNFCDAQGRPARWTVILGGNGVGKTTILQCLAGLSARPDTMKEKKGGKEVEKFLVNTVMSDPGWLAWHRGSQRLGSSSNHKVSAVLRVGSKLEGFTNAETFPWYAEYSAGDPNTFTMGGTMGPSEKFAALICYGYGASRLMAPSGRARPARPDRDRIESLLAENVALPNAEEWLLELDHASKIEGGSQKTFLGRFETIRALLLRVLPSVRNIRVAVSSAEAAPTPPVHVEFETTYGWVSLSSLSLGYKSMIAWVVDLTRKLFERYPGSPNPIAEPAIVLVDELDLHLHPQWQQMVIDYLTERFTNTQFIVTAHSPLVLYSGIDAKVILMEDVDGVVRANHDLDAVKRWRVDQIFTSDLFKLKSAHPPEIANAILRRSELLSKSVLSDADEVDVANLNRLIHSVPSGSSDVERRAEELIRRAVELQTGPRT